MLMARKPCAVVRPRSDMGMSYNFLKNYGINSVLADSKPHSTIVASLGHGEPPERAEFLPGEVWVMQGSL